jgi:hypothetical protein
MSLTTLLFIGFIAWMLFMHLRPGGHGGCGGGHAGQRTPEQGGDRDDNG